ncbi:MAG TPA: polyribonucleotide nucleotidyltransferase, partial [Gemmataceae bacterium]|nr:polyribonucleotide nucleotidyltransferase [Gemmataceae bacterium]
MQASHVELQLGRDTLTLETGKLAKQAHGAAVARYGDTVVLVTAVEGRADPAKGFFPLVVDYRERMSAGGKFPGGFIKREGRPSTKDTLTSRLIDRPIRPLFPAGYINEVQILGSVLAADKENDPDILAMIAASAALHVSPIPFTQVTGAVRVGRINGEFVAMPSLQDLEESDLDLIVAGTRKAVTMIEGFSREMAEDDMLAAIEFAQRQIVKIIDTIEQLRTAAGLGKKELPADAGPSELLTAIKGKYYNELRERKLTVGKIERRDRVAELEEKIVKEYAPTEGEAKYSAGQVKAAVEQLTERVVRDLLLEGKRLDGRGLKDIRNIECEVGILPRVHGSALFQRGETQALVTIALGTVSDEQRVEGLMEEYSKKFMLDYNFPPSSVGEVKPIRGPGRREIGHGMLAERSLKAIIPSPEKFPYTIRVVSDILESNGSSSMATVCGGTLALMDAGVPIKDPVAGISIGLVKDPDRFTLLTDIIGDEDHFGDMDFKIAGTQRGICGIQLDLKIDGIGSEIIRGTLQQAREARIHILRQMLKAIIQPRGQISEHAPRLLTVKINPEKIGALIGPGGKNIKAIQESTGAKIDIEDDGTVFIAHSDAAGAEEAKMRVEAITQEVQVGKVYEGRVTSIKDFGAFIEILPGKDGLCHISELSDGYVGRVDDVLRMGDTVRVKVISIDDQDRVKLSRKVLLREENPEAADAEAAANPRPPMGEGGDRDRRDHGERRERSGGGGGRG